MAGSRYGSHPGDRKHHHRSEKPSRITRKPISKHEKYGAKGRRARRNAEKRNSSGSESSDLDSGSPRAKDKRESGNASGTAGASKDPPLPLDDGNTRSEVDVNFISKSAGILKAESMQEAAMAANPEAAAETNTAEQ